MQRGPTCAGDWEERRKPEPPTNGRSVLRNRSPNGGFSSDGWPTCWTEMANAGFPKSAVSVVDFGLRRTTTSCQPQRHGLLCGRDRPEARLQTSKEAHHA